LICKIFLEFQFAQSPDDARVSLEEIQQLMDYGFYIKYAAQAYFKCERSIEKALNMLIENKLEKQNSYEQDQANNLEKKFILRRDIWRRRFVQRTT